MGKHKVYLQYANAVHVHDKVWFADGESSGLFSLDIQNFSLEFMGGMFDGKAIPWAYYGNVHCYYENKLFLFPSKCNQILVYDIDRGQMERIFFCLAEASKEYITAGIVQYDTKVYVFPYKMKQGVFVLDLETLVLRRCSELDEALDGVEYIYNSGNVVKMNETEIAVLSGKNTIIGVDLQEKKRTFSKRFDEEINIWGIRHNNSSFWLLLYDSTDVYEWFQYEDRLIKYTLLEEEWISGKGGAYSNIVFLDGQVILLPCALKYITKLDFSSCTIVKAVEYPKQFRFLDYLSCFPAFGDYTFIDGNKVLLYPSRGNMLLTYDVQRNFIEGRESTVVIDEISYLMEKMWEKMQEKEGIFQENDGLSVGMLDLLADGKILENSIGNEKSIGKRIYNNIAERK